LNEDLTEAISLGHDLGHTPFGHTGEEALNDVYKGSFQHNKQSLRVVDKLEREGEGLNLTWEVRDGILNHSQDKEKILTPKSRNQPGTLEGEVVKIADALAYVNHDIDDALRAKIIKERDLPRELLKILGRTHRERINTLVQNIVKESWQGAQLKMGDIVLDAFNELRDFMYDKVYLSSFLFNETRKAYRIVSELYSFYLRETHLLPLSLRRSIDKEGQERIAVDYIAGMTDRFAINIYKNYFIPEGWK
jgi:dGTPase